MQPQYLHETRVSWCRTGLCPECTPIHPLAGVKAKAHPLGAATASGVQLHLIKKLILNLPPGQTRQDILYGRETAGG